MTKKPKLKKVHTVGDNNPQTKAALDELQDLLGAKSHDEAIILALALAQQSKKQR